jgi:T4-like virus tail tube protein gp19
MTALTRTPQNTNFLQPTKYLLTFSRISDTQYFCQQVNLPGVSLGEVQRVSPLLDLYSPGNKLTYNPLEITFTLDEELISWKNLYDWFTSIANPEGFAGRESGKDNLSDATLTIMSALNNPLLRIEFTNCYPLSLTDIQFDTTSSADTIITCTASFRYQSYKYLPA